MGKDKKEMSVEDEELEQLANEDSAKREMTDAELEEEYNRLDNEAGENAEREKQERLERARKIRNGEKVERQPATFRMDFSTDRFDVEKLNQNAPVQTEEEQEKELNDEIEAMQKEVNAEKAREQAQNPPVQQPQPVQVPQPRPVQQVQPQPRQTVQSVPTVKNPEPQPTNVSKETAPAPAVELTAAQVRRNALAAAARRARAAGATEMDKLEFASLNRLNQIIESKGSLAPADAQMALDCQRVMVMAERIRQERSKFPNGNGPLASRFAGMSRKQIWNQCHIDEETTRMLVAQVVQKNPKRLITKKVLSDFVVSQDAVAAARQKVRTTMRFENMTPEQRKVAIARMQIVRPTTRRVFKNADPIRQQIPPRHQQPVVQQPSVQQKAPVPQRNAVTPVRQPSQNVPTARQNVPTRPQNTKPQKPSLAQQISNSAYAKTLEQLHKERELLNRVAPKQQVPAYQNVCKAMDNVIRLLNTSRAANRPADTAQILQRAAEISEIYLRGKSNAKIDASEANRIKVITVISKHLRSESQKFKNIVARNQAQPEKLMGL